MDSNEFLEKMSKAQHFFFSELKTIEESELALVIELMRASQHIKDIHKMMAIMSPEDLEEDEEIIFQAENESLQTMILNISAAQLREALKLFWKFTQTKYFKEIETKLTPESRKEIDELKKLNNEYDDKKGFVFESLKPIRDLMFHYQCENRDNKENKTLSWLRRMKEREAERKPPVQFVNLPKYEFGSGFDYERSIYADFLFWGSEGMRSGMKWQKLVWETQIRFINATRSIVGGMLREEGIGERNYDWILQFSNGYK